MFLLDACALLRLLQDEPGANRIETLLKGASSGKYQVSMHIINLGEVVYIIAKKFGWEVSQRKKAEIALLPLTILPFSEQLLWKAVKLNAHHPMSYADCFAAETAIKEHATLVTSDPEFQSVQRLLKIERI
jgi:ribonuclease VapC